MRAHAHRLWRAGSHACLLHWREGVRRCIAANPLDWLRCWPQRRIRGLRQRVRRDWLRVWRGGLLIGSRGLLIRCSRLGGQHWLLSEGSRILWLLVRLGVLTGLSILTIAWLRRLWRLRLWNTKLVISGVATVGLIIGLWRNRLRRQCRPTWFLERELRR